MSSNLQQAWDAIAMGPKLRSFLGIAEADYRGETEPGPTFAADLTAFAAEKGLADTATFSDLIDELVAMDQAKAALALAARFPDLVDPTDFRVQLSLGVSGMLAGDHDEAESRFRQAQVLLPEEPAPYVNLVQILFHQERFEEAEVWTEAGLDADRNNVRLWDLLARLLTRKFGDYAGEEARRRADRRDSWAGLALAADMTTTGDRYFKLNLLERLYHQGERDHAFLIELTAAQGVASEYDKIPPIVWQAERMSQKGLPWQLPVHAAQAHVALGNYAEARAQIAKARRAEHAPQGLAGMLDELAKECDDAEAQQPN